LIKDLGVTGCCIEGTVYMDIKPGEKYKVRILPEEDSGIGAFELLGEARWVRAGSYSYEAGFFVVESPRGKLFQRYVDYLAWRASNVTGSPGHSEASGEESGGV